MRTLSTQLREAQNLAMNKERAALAAERRAAALAAEAEGGGGYGGGGVVKEQQRAAELQRELSRWAGAAADDCNQAASVLFSSKSRLESTGRCLSGAGASGPRQNAPYRTRSLADCVHVAHLLTVCALTQQTRCAPRTGAWRRRRRAPTRWRVTWRRWALSCGSGRRRRRQGESDMRCDLLCWPTLSCVCV